MERTGPWPSIRCCGRRKNPDPTLAFAPYYRMALGYQASATKRRFFPVEGARHSVSSDTVHRVVGSATVLIVDTGARGDDPSPPKMKIVSLVVEQGSWFASLGMRTLGPHSSHIFDAWWYQRVTLPSISSIAETFTFLFPALPLLYIARTSLQIYAGDMGVFLSRYCAWPDLAAVRDLLRPHSPGGGTASLMAFLHSCSGSQNRVYETTNRRSHSNIP